jgi:acyl carrier protein
VKSTTAQRTYPLTPIQHWFFEQDLADLHQFNQSFMVDLRSTVDPHRLRGAVYEVLSRHEALRLRFVKRDGVWEQRISPPGGKLLFEVVDISQMGQAEREAVVRTKVAEKQASLNLKDGPLLRFVLFKLGSLGADCLLIAIHHLAVDAVSRRILLEDLERIYGELKSWGAYANNPLRGKLMRELVPRVREHVQSQLPEYMVPSAFVLLDALPLTPNGKVDRRAFPAPEQLRVALGGEYVAARTAIEGALAKVWAELLRLDRVGVHDDFFELGGHSLLATQLVSRVNKLLGISVPLSEIFKRPVLEDLARYIDDALWVRDSAQMEDVNDGTEWDVGKI